MDREKGESLEHMRLKYADEEEVTRGLYQCVRYQALSEATLVGDGRPATVRSLLVLEGSLPKSLQNLKKALNVEVIQGLRVDPKFKLPTNVKRSRGSPDEQD
jgi:hypothetical protein